MNERIKELAEQAEQYADDTVNSDPARYDKPGHVKVWRELMQAKFAELIVRECLDIAKNWEDELENANMLSESNAAGIVSYRIARQFGVKE